MIFGIPCGYGFTNAFALVIIMEIWSPFVLVTEVVINENYANAVIASMMLTAGLVFILSTLLGELFNRLNLPTVLSDLSVGILLSSSVLGLLVFSNTDDGEVNLVLLNALGWLTKASSETIMDAYHFQMQDFINNSANIGLLALLFITGIESDLSELIRVRGQASIVAVTGVTVPLVGGTFALIYIFNVPTISAIFAGAALTATSIGITAKVLQEIDQLQSKEGQIILGAAVLDDILGIVILALALSLVETGAINLSTFIALGLKAVIFILLTIGLNRYFCPFFSKIIDQFNNPAALLLLSLVFLNSLAILAISFDLEALLGAFAAGLVLGGTRQKEKLLQMIQPIVYIYTTIFFVTIGASVNIGVLNPFLAENWEGLTIAACLIAIAILGKVCAGFTLLGDQSINRAAVGIGMIPRGEVGLVFAGLGTSTGALSESLNAALVTMVVVTTLIAPLFLRWCFTSQVKMPEPVEG